MKNFVPAPKGVRPIFTVDPERQLKVRLDEYGRPSYSWQKHSGDVVPMKYMTDYHILQVRRAMEEQAMKWRRCWYIFDQELRRRNVGMTGRLTKNGAGFKFVPLPWMAAHDHDPLVRAARGRTFVPVVGGRAAFCHPVPPGANDRGRRKV